MLVWYHLMSDKKTDFETDLEEKRAEIASKKSRNHTNNNIYERFISRVQNDDEEDGGNNSETDDVKPLEDTKKPSALNSSAFAPLSANELELFDDHDHDKEVGVAATAATVDFLDEKTHVKTDTSWQNSHSNKPSLDTGSNDGYVASTDQATGLAEIKKTAYMPSGAGMLAQEPLIQLAVKKSTPSQDKLTSSKKPLIIGMIFGSLLIAIIVVTLIFTGVLSTSTKTDIANEAATNLNDNVVTTVTTEKPIVSAQPVSSDDNSSATDANTMVELPVTVQPDDLANDTQSTANDRVDEVSPIKPNANNLDADAAITYEDFRQESQNTLYRETDD